MVAARPRSRLRSWFAAPHEVGGLAKSELLRRSC